MYLVALIISTVVGACTCTSFLSTVNRSLHVTLFLDTYLYNYYYMYIQCRQSRYCWYHVYRLLVYTVYIMYRNWISCVLCRNNLCVLVRLDWVFNYTVYCTRVLLSYVSQVCVMGWQLVILYMYICEIWNAHSITHTLQCSSLFLKGECLNNFLHTCSCCK